MSYPSNPTNQMNTQQRIDEITELLRDIYKNTNEGPRLIAEVIEREFPDSYRLLSVGDEMRELEADNADLRERNSRLAEENTDLAAENDKLERELQELQDGDDD